MFGDLASSLRQGPRLATVAALLGACANVIGVSDYDIDDSLDPPPYLASVLGKQARLEFEAYAWDSLFDFDTLSLKASYCP